MTSPGGGVTNGDKGEGVLANGDVTIESSIHSSFSHYFNSFNSDKW